MADPYDTWPRYGDPWNPTAPMEPRGDDPWDPRTRMNPKDRGRIILNSIAEGGNPAILQPRIDDPAVAAVLQEAREEGTAWDFASRKVDSSEPRRMLMALNSPTSAQTLEGNIRGIGSNSGPPVDLSGIEAPPYAGQQGVAPPPQGDIGGSIPSPSMEAMMAEAMRRQPQPEPPQDFARAEDAVMNFGNDPAIVLGRQGPQMAPGAPVWQASDLGAGINEPAGTMPDFMSAALPPDPGLLRRPPAMMGGLMPSRR